MNPYIISNRKRFQENGKLPEPSQDQLMSEISFSESDVLRAFYAFGQNPDPVVKSKGLQIYQDMMEDDQIKACVELRKQARLSTPWNIVSADEENIEANEMADFVSHVLDRIPGSFQDCLYDIFSAIEYGFSVSELVYELIPDGPFSGKIGLKAIKTREPFQYDFKVDLHGNVLGLVYTGIGERFTAPSGRLIATAPKADTTLGSNDNPFPTEKFIVYSYNSQFGNPYGKSDLLSAFRSWLSKKLIMKFWNIWLERYASPFIWAQVKRDAELKDKALKEIDTFLKNLTVKAGVRVSDAVTLNPIQFTTAGGDAYEKAIEAHNRFIAHAILTPNLLGYTQQPATGSYALGKKHFDAFLWVLDKMGRDCSENIVGDQIIKRLIKLNFPNYDPDLLPIFKFEGIEEESIEARARIVTLLAQNQLLDLDEAWIREFLTLPKREPDGTVLVKPIIGEDGKEVTDDEDMPKDTEFKSKAVDKKDDDTKKPELFAKPFQERQPDGFEKKLKVKEFKRALDEADNYLFDSLIKEITEIRDDFVDFVVKKKLVTEGAVRDIDKLPINVSGIKNALKAWFVKVFFDSKLRALEELGRAGIEVEVVRKFTDVQAPLEPWEPLPPQEAVDFFNRKVTARIVGTDGKKKLLELASRTILPYYDIKAFSVAGIIRDDLLNDAKQVLLNGIKRQDESGTVKDLKDLFNRYIQQGVSVDDELLTPHRLKTIVRTNTVEAVNEGRRAMYEDPDVKGFVEFWEYSAILDDRTTDYCRCMDGKTFRIEDLPLLNPPAHFNCRSLSVPITKFEVEDLIEQGKGIEVSESCFGRAAGFIEKRQAIPMPFPKPVTTSGLKDASRLSILADQLKMIIVRCPYKLCHSDDIVLKKSFFNIGEFLCNTCEMPFRVSEAGDIYLYDAGIEQWERVTEGLRPNFFTENAEKKFSIIDDVTACLYKLCRSSSVRIVKRSASMVEYKCDNCLLPFRISSLGQIYLYDAGTNEWIKS